MSDWIQLIGWPPSIVTGGLLVFLSLGYGTQARKKLRPILLAVQVAVITFVISNLISGFQKGVLGVTGALLSESVGTLLGYFIIGWLIIKLCFIIRLRKGQTNIFTRNRRP